MQKLENGAATLTPASFAVQSKVLAGTHVIAVRGELDLNTADRLAEPLEAALSANGSDVVVDLSACEFIDSTGIALLVKGCQRLTREPNGDGSRNLVLCGLRDQVRRVYDLTGLESSLPAYESREDALARLRN